MKIECDINVNDNDEYENMVIIVKEYVGGEEYENCYVFYD